VLLTGAVQVRGAREDDVAAVHALVESAYRGDASRAGWTTEADLLAGQRTDPDGVRAVLADLLLAEEGRELLGCCVLTPHGDHGYFGMFAVRPGRQGGGVGSALLAAAEARARALGLARVDLTVLSTRTELVAYYLRRGYVATGETRPFPYGDERFGVPLRDDLAFVVLSKALPG
jgi:N-acetylglutamate synthase-like GNAT family acetyltransferase